MNILHVFNPEHDIALASNLANFTAPHAGRQLRNDLGFLPVLWAAADDVVLVENIEQAQKVWQRIGARLKRLNIRQGQSRAATFCDKNSCTLTTVQGTAPWGWDKALRRELERKGVSTQCMPSNEVLEDIRQLSHRRTAAQLLPQLRVSGTVGEAKECRTEQEVQKLLEQYGRMVMKAPWSSSGRGVRFVGFATGDTLQANNVDGWLHNILRQQGSVMAEPIYNKVKDFGMEFTADGIGGIRYDGLSLFHTVNGAYVGNILATEKTKQEMISRYISADLLEDVKQRIMASRVLGNYQGPFGIDMMVCASTGETQGFLLHPCVEINLRRTMGHVALSMTPANDDNLCVMRIDYDGNSYKLKINKLQ